MVKSQVKRVQISLLKSELIRRIGRLFKVGQKNGVE